MERRNDKGEMSVTDNVPNAVNTDQKLEEGDTKKRTIGVVIDQKTSIKSSPGFGLFGERRVICVAIFVSVACGYLAIIFVLLVRYVRGNWLDQYTHGLKTSRDVIAGMRGKLPQQAGCVNLYEENPAYYPNTNAYRICAHTVANRIKISALTFVSEEDNRKHGISYLEAGAATWVTMYSGTDFSSSALSIDPSSSTDLRKVYMRRDSDEVWSGNLRSIEVLHYSKASVRQVQVTERVGDHCAILLISDSRMHQKSTGFELCADPAEGNVFKFSYSFICQKLSKSDPFTSGINVIQTGRYASLRANSGKRFDGQCDVSVPQHSRKDISVKSSGNVEDTSGAKLFSFELVF